MFARLRPATRALRTLPRPVPRSVRFASSSAPQQRACRTDSGGCQLLLVGAATAALIAAFGAATDVREKHVAPSPPKEEGEEEVEEEEEEVEEVEESVGEKALHALESTVAAVDNGVSSLVEAAEAALARHSPKQQQPQQSQSQQPQQPQEATMPSPEEAASQGAFNEETGEINWDCPCLGGMAHGPCGEEFKAAFSCFVYSEEEPKGIDCVEKFKGMQDCFRAHPDVYAEEIDDDEEAQAEAATEAAAESKE